MNNVAIILARGGSKGIKDKNLINLCGKPLIEWTIKHCLNCKDIKEVFVSSDSLEILNFSKSQGARTIIRPEIISQDESTSEEAWEHSIEHIINEKGSLIEYVIAPQVTSPIRHSDDFSEALKKMKNEKLDSLLSVNELKDFFIWKEQENGIISDNYDYRNRSRRQLINKKYHENGSFYIFKPKILKAYKNRLGGNIGYHLMEEYKSFQIDEIADVKLCEIIMNGYKLNE